MLSIKCFSTEKMLAYRRQQQKHDVSITTACKWDDELEAIHSYFCFHRKKKI